MTETTAASGLAHDERVVLCSPDGGEAGTAPKALVHHRDTPLHLAFSCYVFDPGGRTLVTRRARAKSVFPGVRTNSCCGHPAPGEGMVAAVRRRLRQELGVVVTAVDLILPAFRYRATASDGTVENELCPVYRAVMTDGALRPDVTEVDDAWWTPWAEFSATASESGTSESGTSESGTPGDGDPLSPWAVEQVRQLVALGPDPLRWPARGAALLPPAARP